MPDPDRRSDRERTTDPRIDDWPVQREEAYVDWPVQRPVQGEDDAATEQVEGIEWIGVVGGGSNPERPVLYETDTSSVVRGELDEENERVVLSADDERHEVASEDSLGENIEEFAEERDWTWLSSFARTYLEDDDVQAPDGPALEHTEFDRRMLGDSASPDIGFFGSHTYTDATGRVYTLEREFDVFLGESDDEQAVVVVDEHLLVAREPREEERAGDAEIVAEDDYEFTVDVDADDQSREREIESTVNEWHTDHYGPPRDA